MGSLKGSQTTTNQTSSSADPQAAAAYRDIIARAQGVASTPYQAYTGELTAPVNAQQNLGIGNINANSDFAQPYVQQAAGIASGAANPLTSQQIQQYQNPYTQNVVDATQAQFNRNNAQQQEALKGNQIASGAFGGNRNGIGAANLSSQQATQQNPIIAGLYSNSYNQGVATAGQQFQQNPLAAGNAIANFGISGQGAALSGAGAQLGAGTLQQQTQQQADTANYGQYAQGQAFPYQQAQWLAGIGTGVGSQLGGTSAGSTTGPAPNQFAQYAGAGLAAAGLFLNRGGRVGYAGGGVVPMHMADGGMPGTPWSQGVGWIPQMNIHPGSGAPKGQAPSLQNPQSTFDPVKFAQGVMGLGGKGVGGGSNPLAYGSAVPGAEGATSVGGAPLVSNGYNFTGLGVYARGGGVGYAGGGAPFDELTNGDPAWENPDVGAGYPRREARLPSDVISGDPAWERPDVGPGVAGAAFGDRFGNLPPAGRNLPFQDAYFAANGSDPRAFTAGDVPLPNARPKGVGTPVVAEDDEDGGVPPPAVRSAGVAPAGGVAAFAPEGGGSYRAMPDAITRPQDKSGFGLGVLAPNTKTGLLAAGLGMLASRSPNLGNAIGEGGIAGVTAYGAANEADRKAITEAEKLSREAWKTSEDLRLRGSAQTETARHNKATEAKEFKPTFGVIREEIDPDTGANKKVYGWIDPNTKKATPETSAPAGAPPPKPKVDENGLPITGAAYLDTLPPNRATLAKQIADYKVNPAGLSVRGGHREQAIADATRYNPDYDQRLFTGSNRAMSNFYGGPEGRTVRSLNVAIDHLNTLDEAAKALKNSDSPALNRIVNYFKQQTGNPVTTNFDSIKQVVSAEIAKAVVGGQTALHDRDDMAQRANNASAPEQLSGIITEFKKLMAGQMNGLRKQYEVTTRAKNFDDFLEPATKKELARVGKGAGETYEASPTATPSAGGFQPPPGALAGKPDKNGKVWYYDPATVKNNDPKTAQPYPGQR